MRRLRRDIGDALMLLTRLPAGWIRGSGQPADPAEAVWAYPVVGLLVGGIGAVVDFVGRQTVGLPPLLAAFWTLAAMVVVTGALHEDGLADTADGFGGGRDAARKCEIMRDSRIGTYGTLALLLALGARAASIAALTTPSGALLAAGATGRAAIIVLLVALRPARPDGLAAGLGGVGWRAAGAGLAIAAGADAILLPAHSAVLVVLAAGGCTLGFARVAYRQIGGYTGDVLGAGAQLAEIVTLSLVA